MRRGKDWPGGAEAPGDLKLVVDFANTVDHETGRELLAEPAALAAWLNEREIDPDEGAEIGPVELEQALATREALRWMLAGNSGQSLDPQAMGRLDRIAAAVPCHVRFDPEGVARVAAPEEGFAGFLARLFLAVNEGQGEGLWARVKICANPSCRRAFFDASNNRQGRWCSMRRCGNKLAARRLRRRRGVAARQRTGSS